MLHFLRVTPGLLLVAATAGAAAVAAGSNTAKPVEWDPSPTQAQPLSCCEHKGTHTPTYRQTQHSMCLVADAACWACCAQCMQPHLPGDADTACPNRHHEADEAPSTAHCMQAPATAQLWWPLPLHSWRTAGGPREGRCPGTPPPLLAPMAAAVGLCLLGSNRVTAAAQPLAPHGCRASLGPVTATAGSTPAHNLRVVFCASAPSCCQQRCCWCEGGEGGGGSTTRTRVQAPATHLFSPPAPAPPPPLGPCRHTHVAVATAAVACPSLVLLPRGSACPSALLLLLQPLVVVVVMVCNKTGSLVLPRLSWLPPAVAAAAPAAGQRRLGGLPAVPAEPC